MCYTGQLDSPLTLKSSLCPDEAFLLLAQNVSYRKDCQGIMDGTPLLSLTGLSGLEG
jgi:hypothetical protein